MTRKNEHLQIRVTARQKARLRRLARAAGTDVSAYVLARALPPSRARFEELLSLLGEEGDRRYVLAELNDFLSGLGADELEDAVADASLDHLSPFDQNYVAAMVDQACHLNAIRPPPWTVRIPPLEVPWFATPLEGLRLHLLRSSPVPFKRRNLFVDSAVGDRV